MTTSINIHHAKDARVSSFTPDNSFAIRIVANSVEITLFGMEPVYAWSLFDLMRDGLTSFHYAGQSVFHIGEEPETAAALIRRARDETLPHPDPESDIVDTLRAFVAEAV
jgi:hypothetical protein